MSNNKNLKRTCTNAHYTPRRFNRSDVIDQTEFETLDEKQPAAYNLFWIVCICAFLALIALYVLVPENFPFQTFLGFIIILLMFVGVYLWGFYSHKPGYIIKVVRVRDSKSKNRQKTPTSQPVAKPTLEKHEQESKQEKSEQKPQQHEPTNPRVAGKMNELANDPDLKGTDKKQEPDLLTRTSMHDSSSDKDKK